jgi:RNase adapter protein RapZ
VSDPTVLPGFTIITGLSGAGRSEAAHSLEDLGYFVVDNLPPSLLPKMAELTGRPGGPARFAIVVDARGGVFFSELSKALEELKRLDVDYRIVFLEASDEVLVNRYEATRRRHPLAPAGRVLDGIRKERQMMAQLRGDADLVIDTSGLAPQTLRERVREAFSDMPAEEALQVSVVSFGFKFGPPRDADVLLDVRFLPNPHWVDDLRPLPGTDRRVRDFVRAQADYAPFLERVEGMIGVALPGWIREGKLYLTVAIGCTGGHHRSVVMVEDLAAWFRGEGLPVLVAHRDVDRG